jgi:hypothetical protein
MSSVPFKECDVADGTNRGFLPKGGFLLRDWVREKLVVCDNMAKVLRWLDAPNGYRQCLGVKIQMMSLRAFPEARTIDLVDVFGSESHSLVSKDPKAI